MGSSTAFQRRSLGLTIVLAASACAIQPRYTLNHPARTRLTLWRGGATNDAGQPTATPKAKRKKKRKSVAKEPQKSKKMAEPATAVKENSETSIIWSVVGGSVKILWKIFSTIMSFVFSLLSPESTPSSSHKGSKASTNLSRYQEILDQLDIKPKSIITGTLAKACSMARRRGKFLVALTSTDPEKIQILASLPSETRDSFLFWIGPPSPPLLQPSRLSVLAGKKLLASTPPSSSRDRTATWLTDVRERNADALAKLIQAQKERVWAQERQAGYKASVQKDTQQKKDTVARKAALAAELAAKAAQQQRILERRKKLLENLPEEPTEGTDVVTVALRFADGSKGQRRFAGEATTMQTLFDWVDAVFEIEREHVQLQTLTGSHTLRYSETADREAPLLSLQKKMIAFRVTEVAEEATCDDTAESSTENKDDDESEGEDDEDEE